MLRPDINHLLHLSLMACSKPTAIRRDRLKEIMMLLVTVHALFNFVSLFVGIETSMGFVFYICTNTILATLSISAMSRISPHRWRTDGIVIKRVMRAKLMMIVSFCLLFLTLVTNPIFSGVVASGFMLLCSIIVAVFGIKESHHDAKLAEATVDYNRSYLPFSSAVNISKVVTDKMLNTISDFELDGNTYVFVYVKDINYFFPFRQNLK